MGERATLVKFGARQDIVELQDTGLLYMKNLPCIWVIEDEELRGDPFDSIVEGQVLQSSIVFYPKLVDKDSIQPSMLRSPGL